MSANSRSYNEYLLEFYYCYFLKVVIECNSEEMKDNLKMTDITSTVITE